MQGVQHVQCADAEECLALSRMLSMSAVLAALGNQPVL